MSRRALGKSLSKYVFVFLLALPLFVGVCGSSCDPEVSGVPDGGRDGGVPTDGGPSDGGPIDGGPLDAGDIDAAIDGGPPDAGDLDGGPPDAGDIDGGALDAGDVDDGGLDAGDVDGGDLDAGDPDSGGTDAGDVDAGYADAGGTLAAVDVAFIVKGVAQAPTWVAFQDGTGSFAATAVGADGTASFTVAAADGSYAIAWVCHSPSSAGYGGGDLDVRVLQATLAELPSVTLSCDEGPRPSDPGITVGSLGLAAGEYGSHYFGFAGNDVSLGVSAGRGDLISLVKNSAGGLVRAAITRDLDLTVPGATSVDLSPAAASAVDAPLTFRLGGVPIGCGLTPSANIDISEAGFDLTFVSSKLTRTQLGYGPNSCDPNLIVQLLPAAELLPSDAYVLRGFLLTDVVGGVDDTARSVGSYRVFHALAAGTTTVPIDLGPATITRTSGEAATTSAAGECQLALDAGPTDRFYVAEHHISGGGPSTGARWRVHSSPARAGSSPLVTVPALGAIAGFDPTWPIPPCGYGWTISAVRSASTLATSLAAWSVPSGDLGDVTLSFATWHAPY